MDQLLGAESKSVLSGVQGILESGAEGLSHGKVSNSSGTSVVHTRDRCPVEYVLAFVDGRILPR